ncbi:MAG: uroporphyrinogen decarboxylase [Candidatus Omnitrophica bacterium]|nr:uroporphyrinogen decarboxylase [Candidatus Omnitrophota bacterium]
MLPTLHQSPFLKACRREPTPYTPVWLMRQAGRYMEDYRKVRERVPFKALCRDASLTAEITVTAQEKIKADAAIIFSDILLIVESFGFKLDYVKGDGPSITPVLKSAADIEGLPTAEPRQTLAYVFQAIQETRRSLKADIPLIGFAGAPFTLASYLIEGGASGNFKKTKALMARDERSWGILMDKIAAATVEFLKGQVDAGVQAIQLFDSWVGWLSPEQYQKYVQAHTKKVFDALESRVPLIHFGTQTAPFLKNFSEAGGDVISVDHRVALSEAWKVIGGEKAIQGNLDPAVLCADLKAIERETRRILDEAGGRPGHIFNLGHGVLPETPLENVIALVEMVHEFSGGACRVRRAGPAF